MGHDPDIINYVLDAARKRVPELTPEISKEIELDAREHWGCDTVYVRANRCHMRNDDILNRYHAGMSVGRLAATYGLTERRIRQIINRRKKP